ncbi:MAG: hypothetical protein OYG31_00680 [Candidatus Kaiserbacteria bacterium]|nr:hypothetical protein [Candidatus Kaiserbacteria bacterium]
MKSLLLSLLILISLGVWGATLLPAWKLCVIWLITSVSFTTMFLIFAASNHKTPCR